MDLTIKNGLRKVSFLSDSSTSIVAINSNTNDPPLEIYAPLQNIRAKAKEFLVVKIKAIRRIDNVQAHALAKNRFKLKL